MIIHGMKAYCSIFYESNCFKHNEVVAMSPDHEHEAQFKRNLCVGVKFKISTPLLRLNIFRISMWCEVIMEDLKKSCQNLLLKENRFLKLIFIIIASWLIFYSTYTFVVLKPTYSSEEKREISVEDFPEVMICPEPTFDIQSLLSRGHRDYFG